MQMITAWTEIHGSIRVNIDVDADDDIDLMRDTNVGTRSVLVANARKTLRVSNASS
jgi:hypothetical protein